MDDGLQLLLRWDPLALGVTGSKPATVLAGVFTSQRYWYAFGTDVDQSLTMEVTPNQGHLFAAEFSGPITLKSRDGEERVAAISGWVSVKWDSDAWDHGGNVCTVGN